MFKELLLTTFLTGVCGLSCGSITPNNYESQDRLNAYDPVGVDYATPYDYVIADTMKVSTSENYSYINPTNTFVDYSFTTVEGAFPISAFIGDNDELSTDIFYEYATLDLYSNDIAISGQQVHCYMVFKESDSTLNTQFGYSSNLDDYVYFYFSGANLRLNYSLKINLLISSNGYIACYSTNYKVPTSVIRPGTSEYDNLTHPIFHKVSEIDVSDLDYISISIQFYYEGSDYASGYNEGYTTGMTQGYNNGFTAGQNSNYTFLSLFTSIADTPIFFLRSMFNFELFGIDVGIMIMSLLTGLLIFYLIRRFL